MGNRKARIGLALLAGIAAATAGAGLPQSAAAVTVKVLHSFCEPGCSDGTVSLSEVVVDASGNVYGTTVGGGNSKGGGVVFELSPRAKGAFAEKVLYDFCSESKCADGLLANTLIMDEAGNLYGTTEFGGIPDSSGRATNGIVFELVRNRKNGRYTQRVLYDFCSLGNCTDGSKPVAPVLMDSAGHLFGTTSAGGLYGKGVVFELIPNARKQSWTEKVLYSFCPDQNACVDGMQPGGLTMDADGSLYGTAMRGGTHGLGVAFRLSPAGKKWIERTIYSFCSEDNNCTDGAYPSALVIDTSGNLYGTASAGGANGRGVAFVLVPDATKRKWKEEVIYSFCAKSTQSSSCTDGSIPTGKLLMDPTGNLYGTTAGGASGGVVFALTPNPDAGAFTETILYRFCSKPNCADGSSPVAGLATDGAGNLYGTTRFGGANNWGVVFEIVK